MTNHYIRLMAAVSLLFAGCASERLTLKLDIYREKPEQPMLTSGDVTRMYHNVDLADKAAKEFAERRLNVARSMTEFYASLRGFSTNQADLDSVRVTREHLKEYEKAVTTQLGVTLAKGQAYRKAIDQYAKSGENADLPLLWQALQDLQESVKKLSGPMDTDFELGFADSFVLFRFSLKAMPDIVSKDTIKNLQDQFQKVLESVDALAKDGSTSMAALKHQLDLLSKAMAADDSKDIKAALPNDATAAKLTATGLAPKTSDTITRTLKQLDPSSTWADLERTQDPADPAWRVLTDPKNVDKWNTVMATNVFYAEGNSGVIIVRDSPIRYRVQRGNNNPSALIQSQLQITRAVANAAIEVAGAVSGVKLPVASSGGAAPAGAGATPAEPSESDVEKKAALEERARVRESARRYLLTELASIQTRLSKSGISDDDKKKLIRELRSLLDGVKPLFQPPTSP